VPEMGHHTDWEKVL